MRSQERNDVGGGAEGIGDGGSVGQRKRGAQLTVQLGHQQRPGRHGRAVECCQVDERQVVVGVSRADRDLGEQGVHVTMVTRS
jgi:hypothetical protein